jgi:hypothetical protein
VREQEQTWDLAEVTPSRNWHEARYYLFALGFRSEVNVQITTGPIQPIPYLWPGVQVIMVVRIDARLAQGCLEDACCKNQCPWPSQAETTTFIHLITLGINAAVELVHDRIQSLCYGLLGTNGLGGVGRGGRGGGGHSRGCLEGVWLVGGWVRESAKNSRVPGPCLLELMHSYLGAF